jgi:hypothetical protein
MQVAHDWWGHPDRPCRGRTREWFLIGIRDSTKRAIKTEQLCMECEECPVLEQCRQDVLSVAHGTTPWGIQAGMTPDEQDRYRTRARMRAQAQHHG